MKITIKQEDGKVRTIGTLVNGIFKKSVKESKHLLRKLDAWGIDAEVFTNLLESPQCNLIFIKDTETGKQYMTAPDIVRKHGEFKHYKPYRAQIYLPRRYWVQRGDIVSAERVKEILRENHVGV